MIVVVAATKVKTAKVIFLVFCSDDNNSNKKVKKAKNNIWKARRQLIDDRELCQMWFIM